MSVLQLILLVFIGLLLPVEGARKKSMKVKFLNITTKYNPELSSYFDFSITPGSNGSTFDLSWNLTIDIKSKLYLSLDMLQKDVKTNKYNSVFPYEFDYCRVWDGFMSQAIARNWFSNVNRYGNFPQKCPIRKGYYYLKKMQPTKGSIPPFVPVGLYYNKIHFFIDKDSFKETIFDSILDVELVFQ